MPTIFVEGGSGKSAHRALRQGFQNLLRRAGLRSGAFNVIACGPREKAYSQFCRALQASRDDSFIALWIDSEEQVSDPDNTWRHLDSVRTVPKMQRPQRAQDEQVLFMTTCMETYIVADRKALRSHYGQMRLVEGALPPLVDLENRPREDVLNCLRSATGDAYRKGADSYALVGKLNPATLTQYLPSFARAIRILKAVLRRQS